MTQRPYASVVWRKFVNFNASQRNPEALEFTSKHPERWSNRFLKWDPDTHMLTLHKDMKTPTLWQLDVSQISTVRGLAETPAMDFKESLRWAPRIPTHKRLYKQFQLQRAQGQIIVIRCFSRDSETPFELCIAGVEPVESQIWHALLTRLTNEKWSEQISAVLAGNHLTLTTPTVELMSARRESEVSLTSFDKPVARPITTIKLLPPPKQRPYMRHSSKRSRDSFEELQAVETVIQRETFSKNVVTPKERDTIRKSAALMFDQHAGAFQRLTMLIQESEKFMSVHGE